ncbi:MAG: FixH family protein [Simplicispira sp.]|nr:FixH family protein [Simplicispira sp.]
MADVIKNISNSRPWWKYGYVWLIISGPTVVVLAGFYTLWLAINSPNQILSDNYYRQNIEINKYLKAPEKSMAPALKGRNHAATPKIDQPLH